jgi:hypothetical protein
MDAGAAAPELTSDLRMRSIVRTNDAGGRVKHGLEPESTVSAHEEGIVPIFHRSALIINAADRFDQPGHIVAPGPCTILEREMGRLRVV